MSAVPPDVPGTGAPTSDEPSATAEPRTTGEPTSAAPSALGAVDATEQERPAEPAPRRRRLRATGGAPAPAVEPGSLLPGRSRDDTDTGWGERPPSDDDERFLRDVPPHW